MIFNIELAEKVITLECVYQNTYIRCLNYLSEKTTSDIYIKMTKEDVEKEKEYLTEVPEERKTEEFGFGDGYFEYIAVYRKIAESLLDYDIFLMHGSVVAVENEGYMFSAQSGIGKTTHSKLWLKNIPGSYVVNGDKPLIKIENGQVYAYGTPWAGKEGLKRNCKIHLKSICFLSRGEENEIREIKFSKALNKIFEQSYRPKNTGKLMKTLDLIEQLENKVKFYTLKCNMKNDAAIISYNFMK